MSGAKAPEAPAQAERLRRLPPFWAVLTRVGALLVIALAVNQLHNFNFGGQLVLLDNQYQLAMLALLLPIAFLLWPAGRQARSGKPPIWDIALAALAFAMLAYLAWRGRDVVDGGWEYAIPPSEPLVLLVCFGLWALLIEALRRVGGLVITGIVIVFSLYPLVADMAPGPFLSMAVSWSDTAAYHMLSTESVFGIPMRAFATLVIGFLVFGAALQHTGAGAFFIDMAFALFGHFRGGAAKVSIFASGLLGSMSGSVITNVLTTGSMTIPAMKRTGFSRPFAGGVETCASTGGVLMPPVMGATAFVMAMFLNVPYAEVVIAATVPALLFYGALLLQADAYAARNGLGALPEAQIPRLGPTLRTGWVHLGSLGLLIWLLLVVGIERQAPFYAAALLVVVGLVRTRGWAARARLVEALLRETGRGVGNLVLLLAGIGLVVGGCPSPGWRWRSRASWCIWPAPRCRSCW